MKRSRLAIARRDETARVYDDVIIHVRALDAAERGGKDVSVFSRRKGPRPTSYRHAGDNLRYLELQNNLALTDES